MESFLGAGGEKQFERKVLNLSAMNCQNLTCKQMIIKAENSSYPSLYNVSKCLFQKLFQQRHTDFTNNIPIKIWRIPKSESGAFIAHCVPSFSFNETIIGTMSRKQLIKKKLLKYKFEQMKKYQCLKTLSASKKKNCVHIVSLPNVPIKDIMDIKKHVPQKYGHLRKHKKSKDIKKSANSTVKDCIVRLSRVSTANDTNFHDVNTKFSNNSSKRDVTGSNLKDSQDVNSVPNCKQATSKQQVVNLEGLKTCGISSLQDCFVNLTPITVQEFVSTNNSSQNNSLTNLTSVLLDQQGCLFICQYCSEMFILRPDLHLHQKSCAKNLASHFSSLPSFHYVEPTKDVFMSSLGLVDKDQKSQLAKPVACTEIVETGLDESEPQMLTTKSLQSHLTEDEGKPRSRQAFNNLEVTNNWSISTFKSLYKIDLTSPLGLSVRKYIKNDPSLHILSDVESHCLNTPNSLCYKFSLRQRPLRFPVTFNDLWNQQGKHCHVYNFTRKQREDFMLYLKSGVSRKSFALLKTMKYCRVELQHMNIADYNKRVAPIRLRLASFDFQKIDNCAKPWHRLTKYHFIPDQNTDNKEKILSDAILTRHLTLASTTNIKHKHLSVGIENLPPTFHPTKLSSSIPKSPLTHLPDLTNLKMGQQMIDCKPSDFTQSYNVSSTLTKGHLIPCKNNSLDAHLPTKSVIQILKPVKGQVNSGVKAVAIRFADEGELIKPLTLGADINYHKNFHSLKESTIQQPCCIG